MALKTDPGEKQLQSFEARYNDELGQLYLTTKRIVFVPDIWTKDETVIPLGELWGEPETAHDEITFESLENHTFTFQIQGEGALRNATNMSLRTWQLYSARYKGISAAAGSWRSDTDVTDSILTQYWNEPSESQPQPAKVERDDRRDQMDHSGLQQPGSYTPHEDAFGSIQVDDIQQDEDIDDVTSNLQQDEPADIVQPRTRADDDLLDSVEHRGPPSEPHTTSGIAVRSSVRVDGKSGVLVYCGLVHFAAGEWCGIHLDKPQGEHTGVIAPIRYFNCPDKHGIMVPGNQVKLEAERPQRRFLGLRTPLRLPAPSWEDVEESCALCKTVFGMRTGRHHCRLCARAVCGTCSPKTRVLLYLGYTSKERICAQCEGLDTIMAKTTGLAARKGKISFQTSKATLAGQRNGIRDLDKILGTGSYPDYWTPLLCIALVHVCTTAAQDLQASAIKVICSFVKAHQEHHYRLVDAGIIQAASKIAATHLDAEVVLQCLEILYKLLSGGNSYHDVAVECDVIELVMVMLTEAQAKSKILGSSILHLLLESRACAERVVNLDRGRSLRLLLAHALLSKDVPEAQEALLGAIASISAHASVIRTFTNIHSAVAMPLLPILQGLSTTPAGSGYEAETFRTRSLCHVSCALANMTYLAKDNIDVYILLDAMLNLQLSCNNDDLQAHISRGLANCSLRPAYAEVMLRHVDALLSPFKVVVDVDVAECVLQAFLHICRYCKSQMRRSFEQYEATIAEHLESRQSSLRALAAHIFKELDISTGIDGDVDEHVFEPSLKPPTRFYPIDRVAARRANFAAPVPLTPSQNQQPSKRRGLVLQDRLRLLHQDVATQIKRYTQLLEHTDEKTRKLIEEAKARLEQQLVNAQEMGAEAYKANQTDEAMDG